MSQSRLSGGQVRNYVAAVLTFGAVVLSPTALLAQRPASAPVQPAAEVTEPVPPSFDHSVFDGLLRAHVAKGLVDYPAFRNNPEFAKYLGQLKAAKLDGFEEAERIAFWINVYNAYTIDLVARSGETESIRNVDKTFGVFKLKGPWSRPFVEAAGRTLSLDDVEHRILRKDFADPRVHFGMSFAALSGAPLRSEAYTGARLDEQLEEQTHAFLHDSTKNRVDTAQYVVRISPIIARYRADFGESTTTLGRFLADYYPDGPERRFLLPKKPKPTPPSPADTPARDSVTRRADSIRTAERERRSREVWFRVSETPFNWGLNIQRKPALK